MSKVLLFPIKLPLSFLLHVVVQKCGFITFLLFLWIRYDYLAITVGKSNLIGTYCGNQTGKSVRVVGTVATLAFHTDEDVQSRGFELSLSFFLQSPG